MAFLIRYNDMDVAGLKKELVSYIEDINDEELLLLLKEDLMFYGKVNDVDITDGLNESDLQELKDLAGEDESKDTQTLDEFNKATEKWRIK